IAYEREAAPLRAAIVAEAARKLGINYTVLLGEADGRPCPLLEALQVQAFPTMVLLDRAGRVLHREQAAARPALAPPLTTHHPLHLPAPPPLPAPLPPPSPPSAGPRRPAPRSPRRARPGRGPPRRAGPAGPPPAAARCGRPRTARRARRWSCGSAPGGSPPA